MGDDYNVAEARYRAIRESVNYALTYQAELAIRSGRFPQLAGRRITFSGFSPAANDWIPFPTVWDWSWGGVLHRKFGRAPRRFELIISVDGRIEALACGRCSKSEDNLTIHFAERDMSGRSPLKGFASLLITDAAEAHAKALSRRRVRLKSPHRAIIPCYERWGFRHEPNEHNVAFMDRQVR